MPSPAIFHRAPVQPPESPWRNAGGTLVDPDGPRPSRRASRPTGHPSVPASVARSQRRGNRGLLRARHRDRLAHRREMGSISGLWRTGPTIGTSAMSHDQGVFIRLESDNGWHRMTTPGFPLMKRRRTRAMTYTKKSGPPPLFRHRFVGSAATCVIIWPVSHPASRCDEINELHFGYDIACSGDEPPSHIVCNWIRFADRVGRHGDCEAGGTAYEVNGRCGFGHRRSC